jgi:hypothetical protein
VAKIPWSDALIVYLIPMTKSQHGCHCFDGKTCMHKQFSSKGVVHEMLFPIKNPSIFTGVFLLLRLDFGYFVPSNKDVI